MGLKKAGLKCWSTVNTEINFITYCKNYHLSEQVHISNRKKSIAKVTVAKNIKNISAANVKLLK